MGTIITSSSVYESAPWGNTDQPPFLNQVVVCRSHLLPEVGLQEIQTIETTMGRKRTEKWGPRTLDIDILFWDDRVQDSEHLTLPHPGIPFRKFTLLPLLEVAPELRHPQSGKTIKALYEACTDTLPVYAYTVL
jgi:2-amino-4-hydroxy-6-hydroxymethyldihydropteridine diphosphokinase